MKIYNQALKINNQAMKIYFQGMKNNSIMWITFFFCVV